MTKLTINASKLVFAASLALLPVSLAAAGNKPVAPVKNGGISTEMLGRLKSSYKADGSTKALRNALAGNDINKIAVNADNRNGLDTHFSHRVPSKGITDQKSSGRCWLFTGLNVLRSQMMRDNDLKELKLSQNYNFFYDQLEKANLFLQGVIDYADRPMDDRMVDWLFRNPLNDGGQFTGLSENVTKYGVVPDGVMLETYSSNNTARMNSLISLKLREDGLELRKMKASGASKEKLARRKEEMLGNVYRMLALTLGEPPAQFTWSRFDSKGDLVSTKTYTPQSFYQEFAGNDLRDNYVMLMNDPSMYFSCDVGKFLDRDKGVLDPSNFDYSELMGTQFGMNKADRIRTHASASSHAMTLVAVDLDENGTPRKWMVENSWGDGPNDGHLILTDPWFDEYMFRLVVERKYVPENLARLLDQKPIMLPAWDPMY